MAELATPPKFLADLEIKYAQGKRTAEEAAWVYDRSFRGIFQKSAEPRQDLTAACGQH